jgi:hypothetical protein
MLNGKFAYFDASIFVEYRDVNTPRIDLALPFTIGDSSPTICTPIGRHLNTGAILQGVIAQNLSVVQITRFDGAYPAENGQTIVLNGICELPEL